MAAYVPARPHQKVSRRATAWHRRGTAGRSECWDAPERGASSNAPAGPPTPLAQHRLVPDLPVRTGRVVSRAHFTWSVGAAKSTPAVYGCGHAIRHAAFVHHPNERELSILVRRLNARRTRARHRRVGAADMCPSSNARNAVRNGDGARAMKPVAVPRRPTSPEGFHIRDSSPGSRPRGRIRDDRTGERQR